MKVAALAVVALASTFSFFTKPAEQTAAASGALGVEVQCEPRGHGEIQLLRRPTPSSYNCSAYVFDANDTSRSIIGTNTVVDAGERQTKTQKNEDTSITFIVAISNAHDRAATDVTVTKAGKTLLRQKSNVILLGTRRP